MSYVLKIELQPHADPAKTVGLYLRNAAGQEQLAAVLHEKSPVANVSVPPGCILVAVDHASGLPSLSAGGGPGTNTGHGHVWERPDGVRMRCGGPGLCSECSRDKWRFSPQPGGTI